MAHHHKDVLACKFQKKRVALLAQFPQGVLVASQPYLQRLDRRPCRPSVKAGAKNCMTEAFRWLSFRVVARPSRTRSRSANRIVAKFYYAFRGFKVEFLLDARALFFSIGKECCCRCMLNTNWANLNISFAMTWRHCNITVELSLSLSRWDYFLS